jgi:hypothetical protein
MSESKIFVNERGEAAITCPHCGKTTFSPVGKFRHLRKTITVKCVCKQSFTINLDFRKFFRKETRLPGTYQKDGEGKRFPMTVRNVSRGGIGLEVPLGRPGLMPGDVLRVVFSLDDRQGSVIEREVVVRIIKGSYLGTEFRTPPLEDKALGFYLMP